MSSAEIESSVEQLKNNRPKVLGLSHLFALARASDARGHGWPGFAGRFNPPAAANRSATKRRRPSRDTTVVVSPLISLMKDQVAASRLRDSSCPDRQFALLGGSLGS